MTVQHPHAELSAYIDDALDLAARAAVDGHVVACAVCRAHVAQLRATTAFVQALPDPLPSRRLVPRLAVPAWLAPLRTVMTLASGTAVFLFIASSLVSNIAFLAGSPTGAREAAGDAAVNVQAPTAAQGPKLEDSTATKMPAPIASPAEFRALAPTASPTADNMARSAAGAPTPDAAKLRQDQATAGAPAPGVANATESTFSVSYSQPQRSPLVNPWLWLTLAILCGAIAVALHRRLHVSV
ncbi:MAG: zf-HC2 domain-containing protein [Candidatus Limnocylindria bacterium]